MFVSQAINLLLTNHASARGDYPQGVSFHVQSCRYQANCRVGGKPKYLGLFDTVSEAEVAYLVFKAELVIGVAHEKGAEANPKLQVGLLAHAKALSDRASRLKNSDNSHEIEEEKGQ